MYGLILRNNLNTIVKSCFQLAKNSGPLAKTGLINDYRLLVQKERIHVNYILHRSTSSKSLAIKQYKSSRKYTTTWKLERLMGWSLAILIPMAFAFESKELEMTLSTTALLHTYWGCQSMCSDYLRSSIVGKLLPIIVRLSIVFLSLTSLVGAYKLIYEDVGLINMIKEFWCIKSQHTEPPKYMKKNIFSMFTKK